MGGSTLPIVASSDISGKGLFKGAAEQLRGRIERLYTDATSSRVADRLLDFIRQSETKLHEGQRLPMSTEILESSFGFFKQLERQHSKSGPRTRYSQTGPDGR